MKVFDFLKRMRPGRPRPKASDMTYAKRGDLSKSLQENIAAIRARLNQASDLYVRDISLGGKYARKAAVVYLRSMVDTIVLRESVVRPLTSEANKRFAKKNAFELLEEIRLALPSTRGVEPEAHIKHLVDRLLDGKAAILVDGANQALIAGADTHPARAFEKPTSEVAVMGPQIGFTESVEGNLSLIRTYIKSPDLTVEQMRIGRKSKTDVRMLYLRDIAPEEIVHEMRRRLLSIDADVIFDVGMIRNYIAERPCSPFVIERLTERPDTVAASLNHGRIAVMVNGSPFVMTQPSQFFMLFEAAEDYYMNALSTTALRLTRVLAYLLSTLATPIYVAVVTFHHELIPLPLLLNIAVTQEDVPFPLAVTAFLTEIVLDIVREAGVRLPQQFGPAVSIVGALVLGQAAIQAGFVPPGLVIVVMFATIASFAIPRTEGAIAYRLVRFPLLLVASVLGFPGLMMALLALVYHVASLKTLGVPYFSLFTPGNVRRLTRKLVLTPRGLQPNTRPLGYRNMVWQGPVPKPRDPKARSGQGDAP